MNNLLSITSIFSSVWNIVIAILVLMFMVTVHEFGHYIAGKKLGFKINEFSVGFGPAIFKKKVKSGEYFSLRVIPLGGYCAFEGEDEDSPSDEAFDRQKPWKRIIVLAAGAFMNIVVTILIVILTFAIGGQYMMNVHTVLPQADDEVISAEYMLQEGDVMMSINGTEIYLGDEISVELAKAKENNESTVLVEVLRNGEREEVTVKLRNYVTSGVDANGEKVEVKQYGMGILQSSELVRFGFFEAIVRGFVYCFSMAGAVLGAFGQLITGQIPLSQLGGPITTITMTAEFAANGLRALIEIIAMIGINLAVFNLLPLPALDGSKIVFTSIEWVRGKPINRNVETMIHFVGLIFLFAFAIFVDVIKWI